MTHDDLSSGGCPPLAPGAFVGNYLITRVLTTGPQRNEYQARLAPESGDPGEPRPSDPLLRLLEAPVGNLTGAMTLAALQLRLPRLLALRDAFTIDDREYVVIDLPDLEWPMPPSQNLAPEEALAVGVMIGEVLTFLHSRGVAHQHIQRDTVIVTPHGIFLGGLEDATLVQSAGADTDLLFARDANALAQVMGTLTASEAVSSSQGLALERIVLRGADGAYSTVREVMLDILQALPDGLPTLSPAAASAPLRVQVGKATSVGLVRQQNQDAAAYLLLDIDDDQPYASPGGIFLVADGMGGEAQGEVASRIAVRMITSEVARRFLSPAARATASDMPNDADQISEAPTTMNLDSIAALIEAFRAANARIRNMARRLDRASGTTATALMLFAHDGILGHVGDSRAYLHRSGEMVQLTQDHSLLQRLIEMGQFAPEMQTTNVPRNYLYRSLGQGDEMEVDTRIVKLGVGDTIMICSDGLWDLVPTEAIKAVLGSDLAPEEAARELVRQADAAGGIDNSTAMVIRFVARAP